MIHFLWVQKFGLKSLKYLRNIRIFYKKYLKNFNYFEIIDKNIYKYLKMSENLEICNNIFLNFCDM